jgi:acyl-CoA oxidase
MNKLLESDNWENRQALKQLLKDPIFEPRYNVSLAEERELALQRLKAVAKRGYISVFDFERNPLNVFAGNRA